MRYMNRGFAVCVLLSACAASFLACGGRTDTELADMGGASAVSGSSSVSGAGAGSFAGAPAVGGAPNVAGAPSVGGGAHAGSPSIGGAPGVAGGPSGVAGTPASGGAGAGGTSGVIVDACVAIAQTACNKCLCQVCSDAVVGCFSDIGCAAIFGCIEQSGCQGAECLSSPACAGIIKKYGGLMGKSATKLFKVVSCSVSSQNVCACN